MNLDINVDYAIKYGFKSAEDYVFKSEKGLTNEIVEKISEMKQEPQWMRQFRLKSFEIFKQKKMPTWGPDLSGIDFNSIHYYVKPTQQKVKSWQELPADILKTFEKLGIPEAERQFLAGVGAQYESEVVYHNIRKDLAKQGVIFLDMDSGVREYPDIVKKYFGTVVPPNDNKFAALNSAVWSGGSFIYVPKNVHVKMPLQAYFRINAANMGQFERTLIIADEGSFVHYIEGCLPLGEEVLTSNNLIEINDVKEGQKVLNSNGEETLVKKTMVRHYKGELIEIIPISVSNRFYLTPEHPVLVIKRSKVRRIKRKNRNLDDVDNKKLLDAKPEFVEAGKLEKGDFLIFPISKVVKEDESISDELLELLGYYLSEGFVTETNKCDTVVFSFNLKEIEKINHLKALIRKLIGKKAGEVKIEKKHSINVYVYSSELASLCEKYCGKHSDQKMIHESIMMLPPERQMNLLKTYYSGDGSISMKKSIKIRACTTSKILAYQLQQLLSRQGIYASINIREAFKEKIKDGREIYHKKRYIIYHALNKKFNKVKKKDGYFLVPIQKINKKFYNGNVYNFEVLNEPNTYLVKGFAVHNCTAPVYNSDSLHAAVVEIIALPGSRVRYTTIQNWSSNVYNLVTKRAFAHQNATVEWVDCNLGSKVTMKYPSIFMLGEGARGEILSIAFAGKGQKQDAGGKVVHLASNTSSLITSKSISKDGGRTIYRGLVKVAKRAKHTKSNVRCDALILDEKSASDTIPYMEINEKATITHEATVGKVGEEQLFYLMSRGLSEAEANALIVRGFVEPVAKELPLEFAVELNRLIELEMEGSVG
ncbi:MAG: Fe-S cluster assembly protein SufB [Candidatus Aenigmarchaeota archaeon]|nr:Fe-S cluster assembly protein SufB [Candidatus Aenigmarchaeota archaeon]